jgi:putative salt-induced outer membrane protein
VLARALVIHSNNQEHNMNLLSIRLAARFVAGAVTVLAGTSAMAQDKTDGLWRGAGGAALSATSGNTSTSSLLLNADAVRATTADKMTVGAAINYGRNKAGGKSETTSNKWGAFGQYDYNLSPKLFVFGRLGLDSDKLVDLNLRAGVTGGLGYKLINTKETSFELLAGAGYSTDSYDTRQTIGGKTGTRFSRTSLYLGESSSHTLSPTVSFKQRLDLFPGLTGDKALLAKFSAGLGVALSGTMNLTVGVTDSYNSKPAAGNKKNDLGVFTGVNVKFGAM